jgi:hypothetical protein
MWVALILIIGLTLLSIYGAFLGTSRATQFFNSLPMAVYWVALALLLAVALVAFRRLLRVPALLLAHAGCIFILAGSLWGSQAGHDMRRRLGGADKVTKGHMVVFEGQTKNQVVSQEDQQTKELPFSIRLKDFRIEHYRVGELHVQTPQGRSWTFPAEIGTEFSLGAGRGTIAVTRAFKNYRILFEGNKSIAVDHPGPGSNPTLEVRIKDPDGTTTNRYISEHRRTPTRHGDKLLLSYQRVIRDYISELQVVKDGKIVAEKNVEVNHPLHIGGYHFYQHSYDERAGQHTVLMVVSDTGLPLVYAGYVMLCLGIFGHFWLSRFLRRGASGGQSSL